MKKAGMIAAALSATLVLGSAQADVVGLDAGFAQWSQQVSGNGTFDDGTGTATNIDLKNDLNLQDERNAFYWLSIEHPVPVLPNLRLYSMNFDTQGQGALSRSITFNGTTFNVSTNLATTYDVTQSGGILYYEVLDNVVSLDIGLDLRNVKGSASLVDQTTPTNSARADFDFWLPLLYARLEGSLPMGLRIGADGSYLGYNNDYVRDIRGWIAWQSPWVFGVEGGYRSNGVQYEDGTDRADFSFSGPYLSLFVDF